MFPVDPKDVMRTAVDTTFAYVLAPGVNGKKPRRPHLPRIRPKLRPLTFRANSLHVPDEPEALEPRGSPDPPGSTSLRRSPWKADVGNAW